MNTLHSSNKQPQPVTFSGLHIYGKVNKFQFHATLFVFTLKEVIKYWCFFLIQLLIIKFHSARNYIKVSFRSLLFKIIRLIFYVRHFFYWRIVFSSEVLVIVTILLHEDLCDVSDLKCKPNITQMNQCS